MKLQLALLAFIASLTLGQQSEDKRPKPVKPAAKAGINWTTLLPMALNSMGGDKMFQGVYWIVQLHFR
jgi:hypothetical protein